MNSQKSEGKTEEAMISKKCVSLNASHRKIWNGPNLNNLQILFPFPTAVSPINLRPFNILPHTVL